MSGHATTAALALAVAVSAAAILFGAGFAREGGHGEAGTDGNAGAGEVASAVFISLAAAALIPLALLAGRRERGPAHVDAPAVQPAPWVGDAQIGVALLSLGAAMIHFAVIAQHFDEWWLTGIFFVITAVFQVGWAFAVLVRPSVPVYALGAVVDALIVATWIVSRTTGFPVGPEAGEPEAVGLPDTVATGFEVALVAMVLSLMTAPIPWRRARARLGWTWAATAAVVSLTALSLAVLA